MDSRLKVAGHALHPMLIPLPLGMFVGTLIFDVASAVRLPLDDVADVVDHDPVLRRSRRSTFRS